MLTYCDKNYQIMHETLMKASEFLAIATILIYSISRAQLHNAARYH